MEHLLWLSGVLLEIQVSWWVLENFAEGSWLVWYWNCNDNRFLLLARKIGKFQMCVQDSSEIIILFLWFIKLFMVIWTWHDGAKKSRVETFEWIVIGIEVVSLKNDNLVLIRWISYADRIWWDFPQKISSDQKHPTKP